MNESPNIPLKQCPKCTGQFPATLDYFYASKKWKDGFFPHCKECKKKARSIAYWRDRERPSTSPPVTVTCKECGETKPATPEFFGKNPECRFGLRPVCKSCSHKKEKVARKSARQKRYSWELQYNEAHKEQLTAYRKEWFRSGGNEIVKANTRNRRARLRQAEGKHTAKDIRIQYERQKGRCYYCSKKLQGRYHVDHIVPVTRGGSNDPSNLVVTCHRCNESKHDKLPHEWPEGGHLF